jgi:hypothetical protein
MFVSNHKFNVLVKRLKRWRIRDFQKTQESFRRTGEKIDALDDRVDVLEHDRPAFQSSLEG